MWINIVGALYELSCAYSLKRHPSVWVLPPFRRGLPLNLIFYCRQQCRRWWSTRIGWCNEALLATPVLLACWWGYIPLLNFSLLYVAFVLFWPPSLSLFIRLECLSCFAALDFEILQHFRFELKINNDEWRDNFLTNSRMFRLLFLAFVVFCVKLRLNQMWSLGVI